MKEYWQSLTPNERNFQEKAITRLQKARDQRELAYRENNNLSYSQAYDLNREADLAYSDMSTLVRGRANYDDRQQSTTTQYEMTSGATRTKDTSLVSHLNSFNFEPDIVAFDKDNKIVNDLGESTEDLIIRSLEMERWNNRQIDPQREFITQGNVFIREVLLNKPTRIHSNGTWTTGKKISDYKPDENSITKFEMRFERQLITGKNVYLSSIRERDIQKQTEVAVWEEMSFERAEAIYGKWDRWNFVEQTKGKVPTSQIDVIISEDKLTSMWASEDYWNLVKPEDEVGILHVYNSVRKTYMIYINGVMMLPIGYSMYEVSPSGLIPIAMGSAEVIPGYAYAKGIPANTLVDTRLYDLVCNSMAQKMSQSAKPTMANNTGHVISPNLLYSGRLINGLRANGLSPVLPEQSRSITSSETAYIQFIREIISDKSIDDAFSGQAQGVDTATEFLERKKNTVLKLFSLIEGWKDVEEQLARLRIASIFSKWTKPEQVPYYKDIVGVKDGIEKIIGKDTVPSMKDDYKQELIQTRIRETGQKGLRNVRFKAAKDMPKGDKEELYEMAKEEDNLTKKYGKTTRISYVNAEAMSRLSEWYWCIDIRQSKEDDSHLDLMVYIDAKTRVSQLFPGSLNPEYTLQKIAKIQNEDFDKAYNAGKAPIPPQGAAGAAVENPMNQVKADTLSVAPPV